MTPASGRYYIGLMSGTSADGLDAALVSFEGERPHLSASRFIPYSDPLRQRVLKLSHGEEDHLNAIYRLDRELGSFYADGVNSLLQHADISASEVIAIGSHGQTVRHQPDGPTPYTVQLGDPNRIAQLTNITTVADFRRRDMAAGGQGAPLAPALHAASLRSNAENRVVLNLGGMANITLLPKDKAAPVIGFDTGPGNALLDYWYEQHNIGRYDTNGDWAASGKVITRLLNALLEEPYLQQPPPKSTGRELFHRDWLNTHLEPFERLKAANIQATLSQFTAETVANEILQHAPDTERLLVCGGGVHNRDLLARLAAKLPQLSVASTAEEGLEPDWVEAILFAWLAKQTLAGAPGNRTSVTGADKAVILGGIYPA